MVNKNKVSKKMLAILLAIVLVLTTFPVGFASVFAASKNEFSVEIKDYSFSAKVTLTDETDPENTQTETATNGKALFSDFVDDTKQYNLQITDLVGYEDYSYLGLVVEGDSIEVLKTDLTEIEKATASGIVKNENDAPASGVAVSYSAYDGNITGNVTTNDLGEYSFEFYKGVDYSVTITGDKKYEVKDDITFNATADKVIPTHTLKIRQFGIAITVGANGSASQSNVMVDYGEDCPSIEINANQNYLIDSLTIDGSVVSEAVGKQSFDISSLLKNITDDHTVNATFILDEIEVTFNISRTGKIEIEDGSSISTAGTVSISNGNDETPVNESKKLLAGQTIQAKVTEDKYHISSFKVGDEELITSIDNDTHESPIYTFDKSKTTIYVVFALDKYSVEVNAPTNGTATLDKVEVEHGNSATVTLAPSEGYDVSLFEVNGVDELENIADDYTYLIESITKDTTVKVEYSPVSSSTPSDILSNEYYNISFSSNLVDEYTAVDGTSVYVLDKDAKATVSKTSTYDKGIQVNTKKRTGYENSKDITSTTKITSIASSKGIGDKNKHFTPVSILIIIDKTKPVLADVTSMEWSKEISYTVTGAVSDENTTENPSSGIDKVVYGTTSGYANATSEATLTADKTGYSFTISNEENKTYYIYAVDKAGNVSEAKTFTSLIDNTKPQIDGIEITNANNDVKTTSFGTYSSTAATVKIKASDAENSVTNTEGTNTCSGVKSITFNGKTEEVNSNNEASFTIESATDFEIKDISVIDKAGNETTGVVASSTNSTINTDSMQTALDSNKLTISTDKPDVTIVKDNNGVSTGLIRHDDSSGKVWFNGNANFIVTVTDELGINTIKVKLNGKDVETSSDGLTLKDVDFSDSGKTNTKTFKINTAMFPSSNANGENTLEVITNNVSNNYNKADKSPEKSYLYIDTTAPTVDTFEFKAKNTNFLSKALNFLTFGIFFNEEIDVTIAASDANASSGLQSITLYSGDSEIETINVENVANDANSSDQCTFTLKMTDYDANQIISAIATDKVGNASTKTMPDETNSNIIEADSVISKGVDNAGLMIETVKPTVTITCATPAQNKNSETADSKDWYATDTDFNVSINDANSGIRSVSIKVNGADILIDSDNVSIDETFYTRDTITNDLTFRVNTNLATRAEDGSYKIEVVVIDNAGNVSETYTKTIYKDIDAPSVTNFEFEAKGYDKDEAIDSTNTAPVQEMPYGFYFIEDTKVTVTADDIVPTSGVKSITYYTVDKDGGTSAENTVLVNSSNKISFEVPANFKGQIYAKATDNVDNVTSEFVNPNGVVVENEEQHKKTSHIIYTLQESKDANGNDVKDSEGNNLYGANTTVDVEIADTYSGIRQIDWEIITPFDDKKQAGTVTVDNNGKVTSVAKDGYSDDCLAEWKATTEDNLVTVLKNTISVTNNSNDIEIHFTLTDRAGNVTKDVVQKLSIDKSSPLIAIQMNENDDDTYSGFFQGKREATVYVYERNFASSDFTFDVKRTDDNNNETNVSPTSKFEKVGVQVVDGVECYVYKMNTTFTDDGDYNFTVSAQDTASHINNSAAASHKVNDAVVKYSSNKTDEYIAQNDEDRSIDNAFTIDNTKPVVSVSYDNNDVRNDKYFNSNRTATITVNEHNFTSTNNRITYTRTSTKDGSAISEPEISNWSQNGNTYTATINYNSDGDYTFAMEVVDKAGNGIKDSDVSYSGKAPKDFVVDTTIDKPIITGVENGSSYKDSVLPKIDFSDINFKDHKIVLARIRKDDSDKDVAADFIKLSTNNKGGSFAANEETFEKVQENDGIYTLSVEIIDKAENKSSEQVTFTVNRFGSVYSLGSFLASDLNNKYVQSVNNDIVITEYNPDRIVKGSLDVVVTRDGSPVEYKDGDLKISPVVNELAQIGNSGWYQYEYTISKNVFLDTNGNPADGIYKVYVGSEDTVGNKSENISYEDCEVMFRLDHTPPTIKSVSGLENKIVNEPELNVSYEIFDAIGISEIIVEYYGKDNQMVTDRIAADDKDKENLVDVLSDLTSYSGSFTINGSNSGAHDVRIYIKDLAGNVTDTNDENFDIESIDFNREVTVSTNFFVRWYANKPLFWGSIAAIVVVAGGLAFLIAIKRRKKEDERTEEIKKNARGSQD